MLNTKPITRKKSLQLLPSKQIEPRLGMKNKKSTSNLVALKNQIVNHQQKILMKSKSKSKIQRVSQNFNHLNLQKKYQRKQILQNRREKLNTFKIENNEEVRYEVQDQKIQTKDANAEYLVKSKSTSKLKINKAKKKVQIQKYSQDKPKVRLTKDKEKQKQCRPTLAQTDRLVHKKSINSLIDKKSSKKTGKSKQKLKKTKKFNNQSKQKRPKLSKISQIIQRSILYSDYQIKDNEAENFNEQNRYYESTGLNYPIQYISLQEQKCNFCCKPQSKGNMERITNATVTIQKHFRGYIQRKYILQARYIINCVKKIQRFWRKVLNNKQKNRNKNIQISSSLITIKDLNDTYKEDKNKCQSQFKDKVRCKEDIQKFVKDLLQDDGLTQSVKQKFRNVMGNQCKNQAKDQIILQKSFTKQQYTKKLIKKQIFSERVFNSPMNSKESSLLSPGFQGDFLSPKCFSSSQKKQKQPNAHYAQHFKNLKTPMISSPKNQILEQSKKCFKSSSQHQGEQNNFNKINRINQNQEKVVQKQKLYIQLQNQQGCNNLFLSQQKCSVNKLNQVGQFGTSFNTIEQFCFLVIDFLRENSESTEVLIQKLKALKYQKIQSIFKQWAQIKSEQYRQDENSQFQQMLMKQECQKPCIFSKYQRRVIIQSSSIRLFLNQNNYSDDDIANAVSPHSAYINFMFNVFEESIYQSFKGYNLNNIFGYNKHCNQGDDDFLNNVLSQALGNILDSAQMLCGSFCDQNATQSQKQDKVLINLQRVNQFTNRIQGFDLNSCEMWCNLQICDSIFQDLIQEMAYIMPNRY